VADEVKQKHSAPLVVVDAPLLVEAGGLGDVDRLLVVDAPRDRRLEWVRQSRGWDAEELDRREARLMPMAEKRRLADYVIENNGTREDLIAHVRRLWRELQ
jgi:dephospho-CoA kinase